MSESTPPEVVVGTMALPSRSTPSSSSLTQQQQQQPPTISTATATLASTTTNTSNSGMMTSTTATAAATSFLNTIASGLQRGVATISPRNSHPNTSSWTVQQQQHRVFVETQLLPIVYKLQKEVGWRKYKVRCCIFVFVCVCVCVCQYILVFRKRMNHLPNNN
jgi:hypothetical protein